MEPSLASTTQLIDGLWRQGSSDPASETIKIIPKIRPSTTPSQPDVVQCIAHKELALTTAGGRQQVHWAFSFVASPHMRQSTFFKVAGRPMADHLLAGYNAAILAYGQTGSGKTHTMMGHLPHLQRALQQAAAAAAAAGGGSGSGSGAGGATLPVDAQAQPTSPTCTTPPPPPGTAGRQLGRSRPRSGIPTPSPEPQPTPTPGPGGRTPPCRMTPSRIPLPPPLQRATPGRSPAPALAGRTPGGGGATAAQAVAAAARNAAGGMDAGALTGARNSSDPNNNSGNSGPSNSGPNDGGASGGTQYLVKVSMLQIYQEVVTDLLSDSTRAIARGTTCHLPSSPQALCSARAPAGLSGLQLRESLKDGVTVVGLTELVVGSAAEALALLRHGAAQRVVAETASNPVSSRSHCIFTLQLEAREPLGTTGPQQQQQQQGAEEVAAAGAAAAAAGGGDPSYPPGGGGAVRVRRSRMQLVDLAGCERTQKGADIASARQREANAINRSLSTLTLVISRLAASRGPAGAGPVPYRDSKLTFLLQDCLGGNAKTLIIANLNPSPGCAKETEMTVGFALRARNVRNRAVVNVDRVEDAAALRRECARLQRELGLFRALQAEDGAPQSLEQLSAWRDQAAARQAEGATALRLNAQLAAALEAQTAAADRLSAELVALREQGDAQRLEMSAMEASLEQAEDELEAYRQRPTPEQLAAVAAERDEAVAAAAAAAGRLAELAAAHELLQAQLEAALVMGTLGRQVVETAEQEEGDEDKEGLQIEESGGAGVVEDTSAAEAGAGAGGEPVALDSLRRQVSGLMAERRRQAGREAALEAAYAQLEAAHAALLQQLQAQSQQQQAQALPQALRGFGGTVTAGRGSSGGGGVLPTVEEDEVCCYDAGYGGGGAGAGVGGVQAMQSLLAAYASPGGSAALSPHGAAASGCSSGGGGGGAFLTRLFGGGQDTEGEGWGEEGAEVEFGAEAGCEGWAQGSGRLSAARPTGSGGGGGGSSLRRCTRSFGGAARSASRGGGGGGAEFGGTPLSLSQGSLVRTNPLFMHEGEGESVEEGEVDSGQCRDEGADAAATPGAGGGAVGRRPVVLLGPWARRGTRSSAGGPADSDSLAYELPLPPPPGASTPLLEALWRQQQQQGLVQEEGEDAEEEEAERGDDEVASRFGFDSARVGPQQQQQQPLVQQQPLAQPLRERQLNAVPAPDAGADPWAKAKAQQQQADLTPCSRPAPGPVAAGSPGRRPAGASDIAPHRDPQPHAAADLTPCSSSQRPEGTAAGADVLCAAGALSPAAGAAAAPAWGSPSHSRRSCGSSSHLRLQLHSPLRAGAMDENAPPATAAYAAQVGWASPASATTAAGAAAAAFMWSPSSTSRQRSGSALGFLAAGSAVLVGSPPSHAAAAAAAATPGRRSARGTPRRLAPADGGAGPSGVADSALLLLSSPGTLCRNPAAARCHALLSSPAVRAAAAAAAGFSPSASPAGGARRDGSSSGGSSRRGSPAAATVATAGSTQRLRRQVEVLGEDLELLTAEVARRLASEAALRRQLEEAKMEGAAVASQWEDVLVLNSEMAEGLAERDQRLARFEELLGTLYVQMKSIARQQGLGLDPGQDLDLHLVGLPPAACGAALQSPVSAAGSASRRRSRRAAGGGPGATPLQQSLAAAAAPWSFVTPGRPDASQPYRDWAAASPSPGSAAAALTPGGGGGGGSWSCRPPPGSVAAQGLVALIARMRDSLAKRQEQQSPGGGDEGVGRSAELSSPVRSASCGSAGAHAGAPRAAGQSPRECRSDDRSSGAQSSGGGEAHSGGEALSELLGVSSSDVAAWRAALGARDAAIAQLQAELEAAQEALEAQHYAAQQQQQQGQGQQQEEEAEGELQQRVAALEAELDRQQAAAAAAAVEAAALQQQLQVAAAEALQAGAAAGERLRAAEDGLALAQRAQAARREAEGEAERLRRAAAAAEAEVAALRQAAAEAAAAATAARGAERVAQHGEDKLRERHRVLEVQYLRRGEELAELRRQLEAGAQGGRGEVEAMRAQALAAQVEAAAARQAEELARMQAAADAAARQAAEERMQAAEAAAAAAEAACAHLRQRALQAQAAASGGGGGGSAGGFGAQQEGAEAPMHGWAAAAGGGGFAAAPPQPHQQQPYCHYYQYGALPGGPPPPHRPSGGGASSDAGSEGPAGSWGWESAAGGGGGGGGPPASARSRRTAGRNTSRYANRYGGAPTSPGAPSVVTGGGGPGGNRGTWVQRFLHRRPAAAGSSSSYGAAAGLLGGSGSGMISPRSGYLLQPHPAAAEPGAPAPPPQPQYTHQYAQRYQQSGGGAGGAAAAAGGRPQQVAVIWTPSRRRPAIAGILVRQVDWVPPGTQGRPGRPARLSGRQKTRVSAREKNGVKDGSA
ncbi:hypothetical protein HXX76_014718 [Chlamydomonas incerta]|uniref:Kinesin motor domain-containing protein n=1 Tax=Chlamydomonas incerta TaxID=51695 RepID=A0A835SP07_CHLIN|nr:hypothetical protein HXX76_014718 [Chlamydomonas incerta]|eukprot:KAG2424185.1 hypothetical protein HXX76_014718 [Chlamydomonas incerta]